MHVQEKDQDLKNLIALMILKIAHENRDLYAIVTNVQYDYSFKTLPGASTDNIFSTRVSYCNYLLPNQIS